MSSSHQNFLLILDRVCARSRTCICVRVCVKQHYQMIEIFKGALPGELFVRAHIPLGCSSLRSLSGPLFYLMVNSVHSRLYEIPLAASNSSLALQF